MSLLDMFRRTLKIAFGGLQPKLSFQKYRGTIRRPAAPGRITVVLACLTVLAGCASLENSTQSAAVQEIRPGILVGYLPQKALPNSLALIPAPPAAASTALALDEEIYRRTRAYRGTPRWDLATEDANLMFPQAAGTFSCALNAPITEDDAPHPYRCGSFHLQGQGLL
jgi:hypothetical protein